MLGGSFDSSGSFPGAAVLQGSTNNGQVVGTINYYGGIVTAAVSAAELALVLSAWCSPLPHLLVFDNCEEPELLERWRPPHGGCHVLLTSRRASWPASTGVTALPLGILAPAESLALIAKHRPDRTADDPDRAAIAAALGHLPLALHLTGSYLERYRHDPGGEPKVYLAALRRPDLLDHLSLTSGAPSPTGHEWQVANSAEPRQAEPR